MPKFQFLLLDAGIIIGAHELGVWDQLIHQCRITVTRTVKEEADFWYDEHNVGHEIDLNRDVEAENIKCIDVPLSQVNNFCNEFGPTYLDRMDPGEAESLTHLFYSKEEWQIASADSHVFKVLGFLGLGERGISLEEILNQVGLGRAVHSKYSRMFREKYTTMGKQDGITGIGSKGDFRKE
jgi:hypothetical protein